jgi:hypothetical protein
MGVIVKEFLPGDPVMVDSHEGFGGPAHVIETREGSSSRFKVAMEDGNPPPFWAHDFELSAREGERITSSEIETYRHIEQVRVFLDRVIRDLYRRKAEHDRSKLESPEREVFEEFTARLRGLTYGSEEYRACLEGMKPALDHHYAHNPHHPEHHPEGIRGMSFLDVLEMLCDWKAATLRHADGDIRRSIEINQRRFGYSDELKTILLNTLPLIEGEGV